MYGYARVSTGDQSHALQRDALVAAGVSETDIYSDTVTGKRGASDRPEFARLAERLGAGDVVLVWKLDRLGRSMLDVVQTVMALTERGVTLRSLQEGVDTGTSLGRALVGILASLAELERENTIERVKAGMAAARTRGTKLGRPRKVCVELGAIVQQYLDQGMSYNRIARQMRIAKGTAWRAHKLYLAQSSA
ncbi:MAG: recombinase family protein [Synergistaceae bacterium]|nr:recombinase family protein [Synergistaceae bacterium]